MREFVRRLIARVACFVLVLAAGYPMLRSTPSSEAAGTGVALLAMAAVLRRLRMPERSVGGLVPQPAGRGK